MHPFSMFTGRFSRSAPLLVSDPVALVEAYSISSAKAYYSCMDALAEAENLGGVEEPYAREGGSEAVDCAGPQ